MEKTLKAQVRTQTGKEATKKLRRAGVLPAVVYDRNGKSNLLQIQEKEFAKLYKDVTESTIVTVDVDGKDFEAFVKDVEFDIISGSIIHIDLYQVERGKLLRTKVSFKISGNPVGVREGGVLETGITEIEVECLPKNLPPFIAVDVSNLGVNQSIHVKDLDVGKDVKVLTAEEQVVATIKFMKEDVPVATTEDATATTAPATAPATAAPDASADAAKKIN